MKTRLRKDREFRLVYNKGKSFANQNLVVYLLKNDKEHTRLGVSVSKKVGKSVVRSRVSRLIKENFRLLVKEQKILSGYDLVVIARSNSNNADFYEISKSLKHLLKKHGVYVNVEEGDDN